MEYIIGAAIMLVICIALAELILIIKHLVWPFKHNGD